MDLAVLASKLEPVRTIFDTQKGMAVHVDSAPDILWLHQGDLEEYHEKNDAPIAQGLLSADRMPHPSYYEAKKQCETLQFVASAENPADL